MANYYHNQARLPSLPPRLHAIPPPHPPPAPSSSSAAPAASSSNYQPHLETGFNVLPPYLRMHHDMHQNYSEPGPSGVRVRGSVDDVKPFRIPQSSPPLKLMPNNQVEEQGMESNNSIIPETKLKLSRFCNYFNDVMRQSGRRERHERETQSSASSEMSMMMSTDSVLDDEEAMMPPLESFMGIGKKKRRRHFFDHVQKHDSLIGEVVKCKDNGYIVELICFDERSGKKREIGDCEIRAFLPLQTCFDESSGDRIKLRKGDEISVTVTNFIKNEEKLIVSWKAGDNSYRKRLLKMKRKREERMKKSNFAEMFTEMKELNSRQVQIKKGRLEKYTLRMDSLLNEIQDDETYLKLRRRQLNLWSSVSLEKGKSYLKAGKYLESIQCLNKCLKIDEENIEALLTRGRLYLLNNDLYKAIQDFEQVLKLDESEKTARQSLSNALFLLGQNQEKKGDRDSAVRTYSKSLEVNIENSQSRTALKNLKDDEIKETKDKLLNLLKEEKRKKRPKFEDKSSTSGSDYRPLATAASVPSFDKSKKICFKLNSK